ncbi:MAG: peptidyl-prolyl cis-trans isomerase [Planctomycetales bacterium]|nr:peptidyl-prolyl cis-trans isomerase [Planctomycetales bacterium]
MAQTPFDWFRKNSKVAVISLGVLCIMAFVVADPLMQWMNSAMGGPGSGRRGGEVAVTWQGGELTERELAGLIFKRQVLTSFISSVYREGTLKAMEEGLPADLPTTVEPLNLPTTREQNVEQSVLQSKIYADAARKAGMVVGDEMIQDYLEQLGRDRVSPSQMKEIIRNMQVGRGGGGVSAEFVFDIVRQELLARSYSSSFAYNRATMSPLENWQNWLKANDRVAIESAALPATDFLNEAPEPTDAEIKAYFEEYKNALPGDVMVQNTRLPSPTPAFQSPDMAQLQYVKTSFQEAEEEAQGEVTEEEIAEYYEKNKEYFPKSELDLSDATDESSETEEADQQEPETDPAHGQDADETTAKPDESESGGLTKKSPFRLVAAEVEDESQDAAETTGDDDSPAEGANGALDEFLSTPDEMNEDGPSEAPADDTADADDEKEEVEYQTLDEAREAIREQLARQKAAEKLQTKLSDLRDILMGDYETYATKRIVAEAENRAIPTPPAALADFEKLAKENGLEYGQTELLPLEELNQTDAGKLIQPDDSLGRYMPISVQALRPNGLELYEPTIASDADLNLYLVQKIKHVKQSTPKLAEVRDKVIEAWKKEKAGELALKRAQELAKRANDQGESLDELFAGDSSAEVVESELFSWLTPSIAPSGLYFLKLDNPGTVEHAGPDFMEAVFSLGPNEVGAALDYDKTHAYVFRVVQRENSQQELREQFLRAWNRWEGLRSVRQDHVRDTDRAVYESVLGGELPDWKRPPDEDPEEAA